MACRGYVIALFLVGALLAPQVAALGVCHQTCSSNNDCLGRLACMKGKCNDDPGVGTHICTKAPPPPRGTCLGGCNQACSNNNDCKGRLACMEGKCNDDPGVGTHICTKAPPPPHGGGGTCHSSGDITSPPIPHGKCITQHMSECCKSGVKYKKYECSPPVTTATKATLTVNGFGQGQDGGGPAFCTGKYYSASEKVVALSTGWFKGGARCGKTIRINGANGKSTTAKVVDECDSRAGCDQEHAYQPPCLNNIVDASEAVWKALGVSPDQDSPEITWSQID